MHGLEQKLQCPRTEIINTLPLLISNVFILKKVAWDITNVCISHITTSGGISPEISETDGQMR